MREVIRRAFGWSLLLIGVLGCAGGWFVTRRVLKRVDDMTETTRTIMAGDLSGRLSVARHRTTNSIAWRRTSTPCSTASAN